MSKFKSFKINIDGNLILDQEKYFDKDKLAWIKIKDTSVKTFLKTLVYKITFFFATFPMIR